MAVRANASLGDKVRFVVEGTVGAMTEDEWGTELRLENEHGIVVGFVYVDEFGLPLR